MAKNTTNANIFVEKSCMILNNVLFYNDLWTKPPFHDFQGFQVFAAGGHGTVVFVVAHTINIMCAGGQKHGGRCGIVGGRTACVRSTP